MVKFVVKLATPGIGPGGGVSHTKWVEYAASTAVSTVISDLAAEFGTKESPEELAIGDESTGIVFDSKSLLEEWKNGMICVLKIRPDLEAQMAVETLTNPGKDIKKVMFNLGKQLRDHAFSEEFIVRDGMRYTVECCMEAPNAGAKGYGLSCVDTIMMHDIPTAWDQVDNALVEMVMSNINSKENSNINVLRASLSIAEQCIGQSKFGYEYMENMISWEALVGLLSGDLVSEVTIKVNAMSLINAILDATMVDDNDFWLDAKQEILLKLDELALFKLIGGMVEEGKDMGHQLYRFQHHRFSMSLAYTNIPLDIDDPEHRALTDEIVREAVPQSSDSSDEFFGFKDGRTPELLSAYGLCAVQCMVIMVRKYPLTVEELMKDIVSQEVGRRFPLVKATVEIVRILCELCRVGSEPLESVTSVHTMFFKTGDPLEELYVIAIELGNRTWQEMNATSDDLRKVINVVKQRLERNLNASENCSSFAEFKSAVFSISYRSLLQQQQKELQAMQHTHAEVGCVKELYSSIYKTVWHNVGTAKLQDLLQGAFFQKYNARGKVKGKREYFKLTENGRALIYDEFGMDGVGPKIEQLTKTVRLADVDSLVFGWACPLLKQMKRVTEDIASNAFALVLNKEESILFVAPNRKIYCTWTDALRYLVKKDPVNIETIDDIKQLTSLSLQVQLMEVENVELLSSPIIPPVPPPSDPYIITETATIV